QLALLVDELEYRLAPLLQLAQVAEPLFQLPQLGIVEAAGGLLAVTGDEGNGGTLVKQGDRRCDLLGPDAEFGGDGLEDLGVAHGRACVPGEGGILPEIGPRFIDPVRPLGLKLRCLATPLALLPGGQLVLVDLQDAGVAAAATALGRVRPQWPRIARNGFLGHLSGPTATRAVL